MLDSYYSSLYFEHLYGEGGEKEIAAADVNAAMLENFVIADMIEVSFSDKENTEITASKEQMNTYVTALQKGTMTFEEVYKAYNNITEDTDTSTETETDDETSEPMDKYAQILGKEETAYASDYFETALAMKNGEVKLIELENEAGLVLLVKKDINADPYYAKNLDITVRNILKGDEYEDDIKSYAEKLDCDISNYAINNFKVKKIVYPETNSY